MLFKIVYSLSYSRVQEEKRRQTLQKDSIILYLTIIGWKRGSWERYFLIPIKSLSNKKKIYEEQ